MIRSRNVHRNLAALAAAALCASSAHAQYSITVLHNNDGESALTQYSSGQPEYGGVARFKTLFDNTKAFYEGLNHGVVSVFAGDTFLAGPAFQASLDSGVPGSRTFYDALAISRIGYDASILGNHEFDFGPDVLAEFIGEAQTHNATTYLSANLNFSGEASLQALVNANIIAPTKIVTVSTAGGNKDIGIIGATTESLNFISSPGAVTVSSVAAAVNAQIANLQLAGVEHIVLGTHLQGLSTDNDLVASLNDGIDLIIAGGGDEILRNASASNPATVHGAGAPANTGVTGLIPGDSAATLSGSLLGQTNNYPLQSVATNLNGNPVPIVTTGGNYGYLGRVTLNFNASGELIAFDASSGPQRVASTTADATHGVAANADITTESVVPVQTFIAGLAANDLAETSVAFLHGGSSTIRSRETNLGSLVADGILYAAQRRAGQFGVDLPTIAMVNSGGIRANIPVGDVTQFNTFDVARFGNFVSVVEDVKLVDLKLLLENAYSRTSDSPDPGLNIVGGDGRFAHISGFTVRYDLRDPGFMFDLTGATTVAPTRILDIIIGGVPFLLNGEWLVDPVTETVDIATINFSAGGGDQWFRTERGGPNTYLSTLYDFTALGATDQNALQEYIEFIANGDIEFDISTFLPEYAIQQSFEGGRITGVIPEPGVLAMLVSAIALLAGRPTRSRRA